MYRYFTDNLRNAGTIVLTNSVGWRSGKLWESWRWVWGGALDKYAGGGGIYRNHGEVSGGMLWTSRLEWVNLQGSL